MRRHGCAVGGGVGGLEAGLVIGKRPHDRHCGAPAGRSFPAARRACGRAGCRWIRSVSSRRGRPRDLMSIMRSWPAVATVNQLRTAVKLEPRPEPRTGSARTASHRSPRLPMSSSPVADHASALEAAKFDAALASHRDALVAEWKRDHDDATPRIRSARRRCRKRLRRSCGLVEAGWDAEVARRPHGQHTTVVVHRGREGRGSQHCIWVRCSPMPIADT